MSLAKERVMSVDQDAIVSRIEAVKANDFFGAETGHLIYRLDYDRARPYIKDDVTPESWAEATTAVNPASVEARDYLPFAWGKANDCRGLSASRSIDHMAAFLFLAGRQDLADGIRDHYEFYGKPCLVLASEFFGFDWRAHDDGRWVNDEDGPSIGEARINEIASRMAELAKDTP